MVRVLVVVLGLLLVGGTSALGTGDPSSPGDGKLETPDTLLPGEPSPPPAEWLWQFAQEVEAQRDREVQAGLQEKLARRQREMGKRRQHLEQFRLLKLLELLDLEENQEEKFIRAFSRIRREISEVDYRRQEVVGRLARTLGEESPDQRELDRLIGEVIQINEEKQKLGQEFLRESRGYLTAVQAAKFVIFQERFEYELLEKVKQFEERTQRRRKQGDTTGTP
ncbi:MAG TPA: hypothetical protein VMY05_11180 [Acidobacteriota bacterium]|nr:hypothetical protein [Acidobacteriota bacterium]